MIKFEINTPQMLCLDIILMIFDKFWESMAVTKGSKLFENIDTISFSFYHFPGNLL